MGWRDLLDEIATSSRRVRLARGGQTTILPQSEIVKETARAYLRTPSPDELLSFPDAEESRPRSRTRSNISPAPEECRPRSRTRSTMSPAPDEFKARSLRRSTISPGPEEGRARSRTRSNISAAPEDCRPRSRTRSNISPAPEEKPEETATAPPDHAQDDGLWLSYRITEEKVPTAVLTKLWSLAVDPRKDEDIPPWSTSRDSPWQSGRSHSPRCTTSPSGAAPTCAAESRGSYVERQSGTPRWMRC